MIPLFWLEGSTYIRDCLSTFLGETPCNSSPMPATSILKRCRCTFALINSMLRLLPSRACTQYPTLPAAVTVLSLVCFDSFPSLSSPVFCPCFPFANTRLWREAFLPSSPDSYDSQESPLQKQVCLRLLSSPNPLASETRDLEGVRGHVGRRRT